MIRQVWNRLQLLFAQGVVSLVQRDFIQASVLSQEPLNNLKRVEPYGFSYMPLAGSVPYLFFPSGDRSYGVALIIGDERYQLDLQPGEAALHDHEGNSVWIKHGGIVEVTATTKVLATTPLFETTGDLKIGGSLTVDNGATITGGFNVNGKDVSDTHAHICAAPSSPSSGVI